jgi:hypothetical protein
MLERRRFWEDIHPAKQRMPSMRSVRQSDNVGRRMTAMRNRNSPESDDFRELALSTRENFTARFWWETQKCQRWALATRKSRKT